MFVTLSGYLYYPVVITVTVLRLVPGVSTTWSGDLYWQRRGSIGAGVSAGCKGFGARDPEIRRVTGRLSHRGLVLQRGERSRCMLARQRERREERGSVASRKTS